MEYKQIQELIKAINKSNISELKIEEGEFKITIKQQAPYSEPQYVAVQSPAFAAPQLQAAAPQAAAPVASVPSAPTTAPAPAAAGNTTIIKSPMIGTFYRSPSPDKPSFVNVGDDIKPGDVLCIIEAMKLFNEIESDFSGRIVRVLADDASPVEYDQPLFEIEKN
ncbi:MAG TPA: acetyl-CoA carboxylase biotin carboxyl carrier protein [Flavipsychrobacter sp.]|jgi:acetyl-CoA carboxylase biotin carboxyl carrier protein|nr:acetyl-CoA carboxylase biotin carboxyl carrier protein [Flavipsychrobacter sp.]